MQSVSLIWNIVFVAALTQGALLVLASIYQYYKQRTPAYLYIGAFLLVFSFVLLNNVLYWNLLSLECPHFFILKASVQFLLAPLFYAYYLSMVGSSFRQGRWWLHFIPFLVVFAVYSPTYFSSAETKVDIMLALWRGTYEWTAFHQWFNFAKNWMFCTQLIAYAGYIFYDLRSRVQQQANTVQLNAPNLRWWWFLNGLFTLYSLAMLLQNSLITLKIGGLERDYWISVILCVAIFSMAYLGLIAPKVISAPIFQHLLTNIKYGRARLEKPHLQSIIKQLEILMEEEQLYRNSQFSLDDLAVRTGVSRHHISQALSLQVHKSFHDFLNSYRVEYAKERLQQLKPEENIKSVMYDSGFNNRTTFNTHFKKATGMTASDYLKTLRS